MKLGYPLSLLLAFGLVAACTDDDEETTDGTGTGLTTSTTSSTTTVSGCGSYQYSESEACQGCLESSCCAALAACDTGSWCAALVQCVQACGDDACVEGCAATHPEGVEPAAALATCLDESCSSPCGAGTGICGTELSYPDNEPLTECATAQCCDSYTPCYADAACNECIRDPQGAGCDGNALFGAYFGCMDDTCPMFLCGSDLGYPSYVLNLCINDSCCESYTPCVEDPDCNACLQNPTATGCAADSLFQSYVSCRETSCPTLVCTTTVGFMAPGGVDPAFECNRCAGEHCCADLDTCDGEGTSAETNLCVACLNDPAAAGCSDTEVRAAAVAFNDCLASDCPLECPQFM